MTNDIRNKDRMGLYSRSAECHHIYILASDEESVFMESTIHYL